MSVKKNKQTLEEAAETLIEVMVKELDADQENGPASAPQIEEDYETYSDRFSVRVVWDKWKNVPPAERVPMILQAYRRSARAEDAKKITSARGLTQAEQTQERLHDLLFKQQAEEFKSILGQIKPF